MTTETKHTPEPWAMHEDGEILQGGDGSFICTISDLNINEDVRRIVACVNACAGVPIDKLESGNFLVDAARASIQRDAMAAALREFVLTVEVTGGLAPNGAPAADPTWFDLGLAFNQAKAALATL